MSNFKKGDIIVYKHDIGVFTFAVTDSKAHSEDDNGKVWRELMAYYNPYFEENGETKSVFTITLESDEEGKSQDCGYVFDEEVLDDWRLADEDETMRALEMLAKIKHVALDPDTKELRELKPNETLRFGSKPTTRTTTPTSGSTRHEDVSVSFLITDEERPVTVMSVEMRTVIMEECKKASESKYKYFTGQSMYGFYDDDFDEYCQIGPNMNNFGDAMPYNNYGYRFGGKHAEWF